MTPPGCPNVDVVSIEERVPGGVPVAVSAAMMSDLQSMAAVDPNVVVATDFVATVRALTGETSYHDDRNGGRVPPMR